MAEKGIFISVLPRLELAAFASVITQLKSIMTKAGADLSKTFDGPQAALRAYQDEAIKTSNAAANAQIRAAKLAGDAQVAEAKRGVEAQAGLAKAVEDRTAGELAAINVVTTAKAKAAQAAKEAEQKGAKDIEAADALSAAQAKTGATATTTAAALGTMGGAATAAFGILGGIGVKSAADFESGLQRISASTDETTGNIKALHDGLMNLAPQVGRTLGELTNASYIAAKAGWKDAADQIDMVATASRLATEEGAPLENTMKALTNTMNDFSFKPGQLADVASMIRTAAGGAQVSLDEFTGAMHNVEPIMKTIVNGDTAKAPALFAQMAAGLAQMTQNGTGADQASENLRNAFIHLGPAMTQTQKDMVAMLGGSGSQMAKDFSDSNIGPIGVMTQMNDLIQKSLSGSGVTLPEFYAKTSDAAKVLQERYEALAPAQKEMADQIQAGTGDKSEIRKAMLENTLGPSSLLQQWDSARKTVEGFDPVIKKVGDHVITVQQAMKAMTGSDQGFLVLSQLFGSPEAQQQLEQRMADIQKSKGEGKDTPAGWSKVADTLNVKFKQTEASLQNMTTTMGEVLLPVVKMVADAFKNVFGFLDDHKAILDGIITALGLMATAWVTLKARMIFKEVWSGMTTGIAMVIDKFGLLKTAATESSAAIAAQGPAAAKAAVAVDVAATSEVASEARVTEAASTAAAGLLRTVSIIAAAAFAGKEITDWSRKIPAIHDRFQNDDGSMKNPIDKWIVDNNVPILNWFEPSDSKPTSTPDNSGPSMFGNNSGLNGSTQGSIFGDAGKGVKPNPVGTIFGGSANLTIGPDGNVVIPAAGPDAPPDFDPSSYMGDGSGGGGGGGGGDKKTPAGEKNDPIWVAPLDADGNPMKQMDGQNGETASSILSSNPLSGGIPGLVKYVTTFLANLALGNPAGKVFAGKAGESPNNPMYVSNVDVDKAQTAFDKAVHEYGPDSTEASKASDKLRATQAAVGTPGGYFDPKTGSFSAHSAGNLTPSQQAVASAIIAEGQKRGLSRDQITAGLDVAKLESNYGANPASRGVQNQSGTMVSGIFQQDPSYSGDHNDPSNAAGQFFDRFIARGGLNTSPGQGAVNVQVGTYGPGYVTGQNQGGVYDALTAPKPPTGLFGNASGGGGSAVPSIISGGGGGRPGDGFSNSPILTGPPGGGPLGIGGGAGGRGNQFPHQFGASTSIGAGAQGGGAGGAGSGGLVGGGAQRPSSPNNSQQQGQGNTSSGFGIGGGIIGAAEQAGEMALAAASFGGTAAAGMMGAGGGGGKGGGGGGGGGDIMSALANRAVGYVGQLGGIAAEGLLSSFTLNDSALSDPSKNIFGKAIFGLAGAHSDKPNTAGSTQPPQKPKDPNAQQQQGDDSNQDPNRVHIENQNFYGQQDSGQVNREMNRNMMQYDKGTS